MNKIVDIRTASSSPGARAVPGIARNQLSHSIYEQFSPICDVSATVYVTLEHRGAAHAFSGPQVARGARSA
jgi:hypothetical protein